MALYHSLTDLIGNTPLLALHRIAESCSLSAKLFAKLESFNPASSAKDRIALSMIEEAEKALDIEALVERCEINHQRLRLFPKK